MGEFYGMLITHINKAVCLFVCFKSVGGKVEVERDRGLNWLRLNILVWNFTKIYECVNELISPKAWEEDHRS